MVEHDCWKESVIEMSRKRERRRKKRRKEGCTDHFKGDDIEIGKMTALDWIV